MKVQIVRPKDLGDDEVERWRSLQRTSSALSPFLSFSFARVVDGFRPNVRVAVVEDENRIVAFLPFEGEVNSVAQPIGWPMNDVQGIISTDSPPEIRRVVRMAGLRAWRFDNVPASQSILLEHRYNVPVRHAAYADLSNGYDGYMADRSRTVLKEFRRRQRLLEREVGVVSFDWHSGSSAHLERLIEWKSAQYRRTNVTGVYDVFKNPANVSIIRALSETDQIDCRGVVSVLRIEDRPIALRFGMLGPGGLASQFPTYDREFSRYSPGTMLWFALAEAAFARQVYRVDFGGGDESYKSQIATDSYALVAGCVWGRPLEGCIRKVGSELLRRIRRQTESA